MSYLEMKQAPIPDMQKGIISFWFRDTKKQQKKPPPASPIGIDGKGPSDLTQCWPAGQWSSATADETMVPPNTQTLSPEDFGENVFYWNAYGMPIGGTFFGSLFLGPAVCWIPNPPFLALNSAAQADAGNASTAGIRAFITFGDDKIPYNYCSWFMQDAGVIKSVEYVPQIDIFPVGGVVFSPPPYKPYLHKIGGNDGKFDVQLIRLNGPRARSDVKVAQSFIGLDETGGLVINLQTMTEATYKGMAFEQTAALEMWAWFSRIPYIMQQGGVHPAELVGPYWNGYQFEYADVSQQVMGCQPESFLLYARETVGLGSFAFKAPRIEDGGWHHVLFSFDISGSVHMERPSNPPVNKYTTPSNASAGDPIGSVTTKAWLAFDDKNITGNDLQNRPQCHDGFLLPKLPGTQTHQVIDFGPVSTMSRGALGPNDIMPRNAWLYGLGGNPKDGILRYASNTPQISDDINNGADMIARRWGGVVGAWNWEYWISATWALSGGLAALLYPPRFDPPQPTVTDPIDMAHPTYDCTGFTIPTNGKPIGLPVSTAHVDNNSGLEMAELQIWCGKSIDTKDEKIRRLFIDYPKLANGKPDTNQALQPVRPSVAAKVLGVPDILLHGTSNWKHGRNTGKSGYALDDNGDYVLDKNGNKQINPNGQFVPVGKIEKFLPDPKLNE